MEHLSSTYVEKYITAEVLKTGEEKGELVFKLVNGYITYLVIVTAKKQGILQSNPNS